MVHMARSNLVHHRTGTVTERLHEQQKSRGIRATTEADENACRFDESTARGQPIMQLRCQRIPSRHEEQVLSIRGLIG